MVIIHQYCVALVALSALQLLCHGARGAEHSSTTDHQGFVRTSGIHFLLNGRPFYINGFNAYWLMLVASDPAQREKVSSTFQQASSHGLNVVRTWAFSDGGSNHALQTSPGVYNEQMFVGLDFVISEAKKHGLYVILSLVNNYNEFGGRAQYVQWGRQHGQSALSSDDDFYRNDLVKGYYKSHVKTILTRMNTMTGTTYMNEPTILAWELMNEPHCLSDLSGSTLQSWIREMAGHVKFIDKNHLLEIGLEGFYGESVPSRKQFNPSNEIGTDFLNNNRLPDIDFATIHAYPDHWMPGSSVQAQTSFTNKWMTSHVEDAGGVLRKPLMLMEFGKSSRASGYNVAERDAFFSLVYDAIYSSARGQGAFAGGLFWQLLVDGMENLWDGYEVIFSQSPSTASLIWLQSRRISALNRSSPGLPGQ
ncbi:Mannan endo-1,4-beta-mannosidase 1 [Apostasia shenzhenica]|uniref:mannan endo-1,4-beta-mannosidase n=1 Tax=Apostasia shenzhenica TaxID=1088818 RepID=A0A2I0AGC5_9ASPA|nr:Mannan endo-1,4-beta-mannosidase 1 [Apostasia shenzhenica]